MYRYYITCINNTKTVSYKWTELLFSS